MNWKEYLELSEKTLSNEFLIEHEDFNGLHATMGIITEIQELIEWNSDKVGKTEEIADITWYLAIFGREFNIEALPNAKKMDITYNILSKIWKKQANRLLVLKMYDKSSIMLDIYKKKTFYGKEVDAEVLKTLTNDVLELVITYCKLHDISIHEAFNKNINKLKKRYGDKFNTQGAINRDIEAERDILEGK